MTSAAPETPTPAPETQDATAVAEAAEAPTRKRPKPGERRVQILQALATMLEQPGAERITTAALAARLEVSEAALYRHFASKAQMFEGLIEFIEQTVFGLINQLGEREPDARARCRKLVALLLQFGEKNPGMTRVMVGDALVFENERLQQRMNQFFDKIEATLRQCLRTGVEAQASAGELRNPVAYRLANGRWRLSFELLPGQGEVVELRARLLAADGAALSETWLSRWPA